MNIAVIGAGYGDEGKGLLVDALFRRYKMNSVTRFSGGSQAGHTVVTPDGRRREFHGLCAATYAGAITQFSSRFVLNPYKLSEEIAELVSEGVCPLVDASPMCIVTTVYDMVINAISEIKRGDSRHGSCGLGINETIRRNEKTENLVSGNVSLKLVDPWRNHGYIESLFSDIKIDWVLRRLSELGIKWNMIPSPYIDILEEDSSVHAEKFLQAIDAVRMHCVISEGANDYSSTIFEGSQGLMLDQRYGFFPHVTPGLVGCADAPGSVYNCVYVTRAYASRHGAGPLPHEDCSMQFVDETNVKNDWQGSIRYAPLDVDRMRAAIHADRFAASNPKCFLAVTHMDQMGDDIPAIHHCSMKKVKRDDFPGWLAWALGVDLLCESWGPCSTDIEWCAEPLCLTRREESFEACK